MKYLPLTKIIKTEEGQECVACSFFDTEKCQIHNCAKCEMFAAILNKLHEFEEIIGEIDYTTN